MGFFVALAAQIAAIEGYELKEKVNPIVASSLTIVIALIFLAISIIPRPKPQPELIQIPDIAPYFISLSIGAMIAGLLVFFLYLFYYYRITVSKQKAEVGGSIAKFKIFDEIANILKILSNKL